MYGRSSGVLEKLHIAFIAIVIAVGFIGFGVTTIETIPNHAQIVVFPERREWVPMHEDALMAYRDIIGKEAFDSAIMIRSSWRAVEDDTFGDIKLHDNIRKMNSWTITEPRALILGGIFGQKERWREDGSWIY